MTAAPKSVPAATRLLERYAELDGKLAAIQERRSAAIAAANAAADAEATPLLKAMSVIASVIEPWFQTAGKALLPKGRKSMELGGCMIGCRVGRPSLTVAGDEQAVIDVLSGLRWAKPFLRVKTTLNKTAVMSALDGRHKVALAELGITRADGEEQFFLERTEQAGTRQPG